MTATVPASGVIASALATGYAALDALEATWPAVGSPDAAHLEHELRGLAAAGRKAVEDAEVG